MMRAFRSEWTKLLRPGQILGSWGPMVGFAILFAILFMANSSATADLGNQTRGPPKIPFSLLEQPDGVVFAFNASGGLLGIVALVVAAANLATEYTAGTLKSLLVREPRRPVLLVGKVTAVLSFILVGVLLTLLCSIAASVLVASGRGIDTSGWWSLDGMKALGTAVWNVSLAACVWVLMGTMLASIFRSGPPAIGIGIAYPLLVEGLLGLVLPDVTKWMPGQVLSAFTSSSTSRALGDTGGVDYVTAGLLVAAYAVVFFAVPLLLLQRRDVA